jgi:hypothetical protein
MILYYKIFCQPLPRALESGKLNLALSLIKNDVNVNSHKFNSDSPLQIGELYIFSSSNLSIYILIRLPFKLLEKVR